MEVAFEWVLILSPLLLVPALMQRAFSKPLALFGVAVLIGGLTALFDSIAWGGPGDAAMGRGLLVLYGYAACSVIMITAAFVFMWNPPKAEGAVTSDGNTDMES